MTTLARVWPELTRLIRLDDAPIHALTALFVRVGAIVSLLPGFGERTLPMRVKLAVALGFALLLFPALAPLARAAAAADPGLAAGEPFALLRVFAAEALTGVALGIAARLLVMSLQLAGAIAGQATSVSQIAGAQVTPDPMPAVGALLTVGGIALAMALGLPVKAAVLILRSYEVVPLGGVAPPGDLAQWGVARAGAAFGLAFSLAAPFVVASFAYNLALGALNRAMPQLMVAFVGAPAITMGALVILWIGAPEMLAHWSESLDEALAFPFRSP
ncbi:flagellar biosynthetic protein FliR [Albimonas sp. CAU 1670]|uniref:flagellar biosynthetic protein FliR n=1 Tax=Albimonas sp. CAU 1670 TaxID=3032599 RepID=UPI0023D97B72|nr:flagellar biosynthetic protein FliR [Albimonas sp. CAU 1670]MDF2233505.1 flagellar biosynthetic protein FliR [Albimonas sp. CAU 1670]